MVRGVAQSIFLGREDRPGCCEVHQWLSQHSFGKSTLELVHAQILRQRRRGGQEDTNDEAALNFGVDIDIQDIMTIGKRMAFLRYGCGGGFSD